MADEVTKPRPLGEEDVQDIQITLKSDANPMSVRELRVCNSSYFSGLNFLFSPSEERTSPYLLTLSHFFFDSLSNQSQVPSHPLLQKISIPLP